MNLHSSQWTSPFLYFHFFMLFFFFHCQYVVIGVRDQLTKDALQMLLIDLTKSNTSDVKLYQTLAKTYQDILPPGFQLDIAFIENTNRANTLRHEQELSSYKSSLTKESIRVRVDMKFLTTIQ